MRFMSLTIVFYLYVNGKKTHCAKTKLCQLLNVVYFETKKLFDISQFQTGTFFIQTLLLKIQVC